MDNNNHKRPGQIDFSGYSTEQLRYLESSINRNGHPDDYRHLVAELARRHSAQEIAGHEYPIRFTRFGSVPGWLTSLYQRSPLYGRGAIRFEADEIVLRGQHRTWLGAPLRTELRIDSRHVRNAVQQNDRIRFEVHAERSRRRFIRFNADEPETAAAILGQLPATRTEGFDEHWMQLRAYQEAVLLRTPRTWATPVLICLNVLVFIAMVLAGHGSVTFDPGSWAERGVNTGLYTINGQWWRLVTALFLHGSFLHLFFNMWALWGAGRLTERLYGTGPFLLLYFLCGIVASLSTLAWNPVVSSIGASGAIFGILGACVVFLLKPCTRVPRSVLIAQGVSTVAFVIFSLLNGFTSANIDNAAHVGGLMAGALFGWILARPLNAREQEPFSIARVMTAATAICLIAAASTWQLFAIHGSQSAPERFWTSHQWFLEGQAKALRAAADLEAATQRGTLSTREIVHVLESDVLPFWKEADERLQAEPDAADPEEQQFALLVTQFAGHRRDAVEDWLEAIRDENQERALDAASATRLADASLARVTRLELRPQTNRFHSLAGSRYVKAFRNQITRATWHCALPRDRTLPADWERHANDGLAGRIAGGCAAQRVFETGDYSVLDGMLHPAAGPVADLLDGNSRLSGVVGGLEDLFEQYGDVQGPLSRLADWRRESPESDGPDLVESILFRSWAWSARGRGTRETVSPQGWAFFAQRLEMAAAALQDAELHGTPSPVKYELAMAMDLETGKDAKHIRSTFDSAVAQFPDYYPLYTGMIRVLLPRWGGSFREADDFFDDVLLNTDGARTSEMYARLYSVFASMEGDETRLFADTYARWPRMKSGFEDMLKRYPESESIRNTYAAFACRAKDIETYRSARQSIHRVIANDWTTQFSPEACDKLLQAQ